MNCFNYFPITTLSSGLYFANHFQLPWGHLFIGSEAFSHLGEGMHFSARQKGKKKREVS